MNSALPSVFPLRWSTAIRSRVRVWGLRILGEVKREYADLLREADAIFIEELRKADLYDKVSQASLCSFL